MQTVQVYDPSAIENLAICSEIAKTMSDLHDGADFYARALSSTLALAQKFRASSGLQQMALDQWKALSSVASEGTDTELPLPEPRLHSLILRFHGLALALGRVPDIEAVMKVRPLNVQ